MQKQQANPTSRNIYWDELPLLLSKNPLLSDDDRSKEFGKRKHETRVEEHEL